MWLNPRYQTALARAHLADFQAVMACRDGYCLRALEDRENWRLEIRDGPDLAGRLPQEASFSHLRILAPRETGDRPGAEPGHGGNGQRRPHDRRGHSRSWTWWPTAKRFTATAALNRSC